MSYLDLPRLHFSGEFVTDPSTANNTLGTCCDPTSAAPPAECNYNPAVTIDSIPARELWNKGGKHHFVLRDCTVHRTLDGHGALFRQTSQDALIGGTVASTNEPRPARLVDLDPMHQSASQIWGLRLKVADRNGSGFTAELATATLRELWPRRAPGGFPGGFGGTFQSVLTDITWIPSIGPMQSVVLEELRQAELTRLSVKLVLYGYVADATKPGFTSGRAVGTIGPAQPGDADHVPNARVLVNDSGMFGAAPFKVDAPRRKLVIDLGNAIPEVSVAGPRAALGALEPQIVATPPARPTTLGRIDYSLGHYLETSGIEEIDLTPAQVRQLANRPLRLRATGPPARLVLSERATGVQVDASEVVVRLDPGEEHDIELLAMQFGAPASNVDVSLAVVLGAPASGLSLFSGSALSTPVSLPGSARTTSSGRVTVRLRAGNPGHPRAHIDGALYLIGFFDGTPSAATLRGTIAVRVFDTVTVPSDPTWSDVSSILTQYFRLYPSMRFIDLHDEAVVRGARGAIATALRRPVTDPGYMPVTRDLSRDKKAVLLRWLDRGAPH